MNKMRLAVLAVLIGIFLTAGCAARIRTDRMPEEHEVTGPREVTPDRPARDVADEEERIVALVDEAIPVAKPDDEDARVRAPLTDIEKEIFQTVYFDFDRYEIRSDTRAVLEKMADYLKETPGLGVVIEGHTCDIGTDEYNMTLGERRSLAVRRYLVALGVSAGRMSTVSYGLERPADARPVEEARRLNRRCEFKLID